MTFCGTCGGKLVEVGPEGGRCQQGHWTSRTDFRRADAEPTDAGADAGPSLVVQFMSAVESRPIAWIWPRWLAKGKLHILGGLGGIGKGTITAELAAHLSTGTGRLPDGTPAPFVKTLFVLSEDAPDDTLKPRLALHGAEMTAIAHIVAVRYPDRGNGLLSLRDHVPLLESEIIRHGFGLVVIDALSDFMTGADRNSEGEVRDILTPLGDMARRTGVAFLGVMHPGKGNADLKGFQRLLGASAFGNVARVVWLAAESPDGEGRNLLGVDKSNLAIKPKTLIWSRAEDAPICWHGESDVGIGDALGSSSAKPRDDAEGFLREVLAGGSVESERVYALGKSVGLRERTIRRAADQLRVERYRPAGEKNPRWSWKLPNGSPSDELATPLDTHLANSSSRHDQTRLDELANGETQGVANSCGAAETVMPSNRVVPVNGVVRDLDRR